MSRIMEVLRARKDGVSADFLAACGKVAKYRVAGFVKVLRGEGFTVEYSTRRERDGWSGAMKERGYYTMKEK
jgi:hypothetical protein